MKLAAETCQVLDDTEEIPTLPQRKLAYTQAPGVRVKKDATVDVPGRRPLKACKAGAPRGSF